MTRGVLWGLCEETKITDQESMW